MLGASLPALSILGPAPRCDQPDPARTGNGFAHTFADDVQVLASLGVTDVRIGFDWARLQPRPNDLDGSSIEWYGDVLAAASSVGIGVWASLLERTIPTWFDDEGGFGDAKAAGRRWPRFVENVAEVFGDRLAGWFPMDDPIGYAARCEPDDARRHGEIVDTLIVGWRDAWRILRGGPPVAGSFGVRHVRPHGPAPDAIERSRREDHLRYRTFLRGLRDGTIVIPGRADRELADLAGAIDIVGAKVRSDLGDDVTIHDESLRRWDERLQTILHHVRDEAPDRPLIVTTCANRRRTVETDRDAEVLMEATLRAIDACSRGGMDIATVFVEPGIAIDAATSAHALIDDDRHVTLVGHACQRWDASRPTT